MELKIFSVYESLSEKVAEEVITLIKNDPTAVFCLASGDSPRLACKLIAQGLIKEKIDVSRATFIGLDEWIGIPPENEGSCNYFFKTLLLDVLNLCGSQYHLFNSLANDLDRECEQMDEFIFQRGKIDLMIVGIGMNGHIGFNEPGISFEKYSHVADLDEVTSAVGQKYFDGPVRLQKGITLGLKHLMESKKMILLANGRKKAEVIKRAMEGKVTTEFPASIIQKHPNCYIMIEEEAASLLNKESIIH